MKNKFFLKMDKLDLKILKYLKDKKEIDLSNFSKKTSLSKEKIKNRFKKIEAIYSLHEINEFDVDPTSGKLFAYVYETGEKDLKDIAMEAFNLYAEKNVLDFTVFKSDILFEREIVNFGKKLMHGNENVVGTVTYGGTESIFLAVKAARDRYKKLYGKDKVPEIIAPVTIHPAFLKAADYMVLNIKRVPVNENLKANIESIKESITDKTALIAISAPNWPYGTIDDVKDISDIALDKNIPLHVDSCVGGFILPFFEMLDEKVPPFDFRVPGVSSISLDVHKYGYTTKGASIVLFSSPDYKKFSIYVDSTSPGYLFVNQAVLSSRSVGPFAAAYATIKYLGIDGYKRLAKKVLIARDRIYSGLKELGFRSTGPVESSILSLYSDKVDLLGYAYNMKNKGWHISLQKPVKDYNIPLNIHLTISPVHYRVAQRFIIDSRESISIPSKINMQEIKNLIENGEMGKVVEYLENGSIDSGIIPILLENLPEDIASDLVKDIVIGWFK